MADHNLTPQDQRFPRPLSEFRLFPTFLMFGLDLTSTLLYSVFQLVYLQIPHKNKIIKQILYEWPMKPTERPRGGPRAQDTKKSRHRLLLAMIVVEEAITQSSVGGTERHSTQLSDIPQSHRSGTVKHLTLQGALIAVSQHTHSTHVKKSCRVEYLVT